MIYTVTLNPSLDYVTHIAQFKAGKINRTISEFLYPGGKGINVSILLHNLGIPSVTFGFIGGFTGDEICKQIQDMGIETDFVRVSSGISRINMKVLSKEETQINGLGPSIKKKELELFYQKLDKLQDGDILVLSGSIPNSLPDNIYQSIMEKCKDKKIRIVVDAVDKALSHTLPYHPFLIKPNCEELEEYFKVSIKSTEDAIFYGMKLKKQGAQNVLISMGKKGAVLITEKMETIEKKAPKGTVINTVGSGDSMVAGFLYGYDKEQNYVSGLNWGIAAGSASAFSEGLATKEKIEEVRNSIDER